MPTYLAMSRPRRGRQIIIITEEGEVIAIYITLAV